MSVRVVNVYRPLSLDRAKTLPVWIRNGAEEERVMATAKDELTKIIQDQPDDSSYDEILRELAFNLMVHRGLSDSDEGRTISNTEMRRRIRLWQK
jgi:hypothetical protein